MLPVETPFKTYTDLDGKPLDQGFVYFGQPNQNPITAPVTVFWDAAGTLPASQPLRTTNGYIVRGGTPANVFFNGAYSELVQDKNAQQVFYARTSDEFSIATAVSTFLSSIGGATGAALVGFMQGLAGAKQRTVAKKLGDEVTLADFLDTDSPTPSQARVALQAMLSSGKKNLSIIGDYVIDAGVEMQANQRIDFKGGSLTLAAGASVPNGVLYANNKANIKVIDPIIDASATVGTRAISFINCPKSRVIDGLLSKAIIALEAASNTARMDYIVRGTIIAASFAAPCVYISAANGVSLEGLSLSGGQEGVGIYNDARHVKHTGCDSFNQTQDGFVIIAGQRISYGNCNANNNGQSGYTTQRSSSATNTRHVMYTNCTADGHVYDGFDLRGANDGASWNTDIFITCTGCIATNNQRTGFYVVNAEGTQLVGCTASGNGMQNFNVYNSNRAKLSGCTSSSGATTIPSGTYKAGILIENSGGVTVASCTSTNAAGATQDYGISFVGTSTACQVIGGLYENNSVSPYNMGTGNRLIHAQANKDAGVGVFLLSISEKGTYEEAGFGIPAHARPLGSSFNRLDGGGAELYLSNGGGSWYKLT